MPDNNEWLVYERHCKNEFTELKEGNQKINDRLDIFIEKVDSLILGNGNKGIKTIQAEQGKDIEELKSWKKWVVGIWATLFIPIVGKIIWDVITKIG